MFPIAANSESDGTLYVDDVFSTYLYTGNGSTQTITNGIDLAGKGGMTWIKSRSDATDNALYDTARGATYDLVSNSGNVQTTQTTGLTTFNSNGFSIGTLAKLNTSASTYASWTFRKAPKFFDVVTWAGNNVNGRQIPHNLGITPGCIMVKYTSPSGAIDWAVYHVGVDATSPQSWVLALNTTAARAVSGPWNNTAPTSTNFTISNAAKVNASGSTYVAYLFAHDTSSTGIIQCGSFTTDGSGNATVNLGWEPQYWFYKNIGVESWQVYDTMRGWSQTSIFNLNPNSSGAEGGGIAHLFYPTATGFECVGGALAPSTTFIYMAIRRPNKPPTSGTQVYTALTRSGNGSASAVVSTIINPDLFIHQVRNGDGYGNRWIDRLRGTASLISARTEGEAGLYNANAPILGWDTDKGIRVGNVNNNWDQSGAQFVEHAFKRAPGFFDVVCYTGNATARAIPHNLQAVPELVIIKNRDGAGVGNWIIWHKFLGANGYMVFSNPSSSGIYTNYFPILPTTSNLNVGDGGVYGGVNASATTYVAYMFATLAGISKVGSYTGNGSTQNIDCGFVAKASTFVMIRRVDADGDWYVWDTARGIVDSNDSHLSLNTMVAEVITDDSIDLIAGGFTVNQNSATNINVSSSTYIYLSITASVVNLIFAPAAPTILTATATGTTTATITFSIPTTDGGTPIIEYTVKSYPGGITSVLLGATAAPVNISGLSPATAYTFTITATNTIGTGPESSQSLQTTTYAT
jgi:Fibronectin type III domain